MAQNLPQGWGGGAFWDAVALANCRHERWLTDVDEYGDRICAICEQPIMVVLTQARFEQTIRAMRDAGY